MKRCARCQIEKPLDDFPFSKQTRDGRYSYCKLCKAEYMRENFQANKPARRLRERKYRMQKAYGISPADYEALLKKQGGVCGICKTDEPRLNKNAVNYCSFSFHVDHCHETGEVRGLLCGPCNVALGGFRDDPALLRSALRYLRR